ncbi:MAG: Dabb family protein [Spirochaetales bacterium]|nr:Dabb family protein [Spirochaetales bacterium]
MIKHVVFFQFHPEHKASRQDAVNQILSMKGKIPGLVDLTAGVDFKYSARSWDVALIATLTDQTALDVYDQHPVHQPVKSFLKTLYSQAASVDFEEGI